MGDNVATPNETVDIRVPAQVVGLLNRVLQLPAGIHIITVVKTSPGKAGLVGWQVAQGADLEQPRVRAGRS